MTDATTEAGALLNQELNLKKFFATVKDSQRGAPFFLSRVDPAQ